MSYMDALKALTRSAFDQDVGPTEVVASLLCLAAIITVDNSSTMTLQEFIESAEFSFKRASETAADVSNAPGSEALS